MQLGNR